MYIRKCSASVLMTDEEYKYAYYSDKVKTYFILKSSFVKCFARGFMCSVCSFEYHTRPN